MSGWTADLLRQRIGEYISTTRPRTPLEIRAYGGAGSVIEPVATEGGGGVLVDVLERSYSHRHGDDVEDFGVVPHVVVDYGMSWPILPGTTITFVTWAQAQRSAFWEGAVWLIGSPFGTSSDAALREAERRYPL